MGLLYCKYYNLIIKEFEELFESKKVFNIFTYMYIFFMIYDIVISFVATYRQKKRINGVEAKNKFERYIDKKYNDSYLEKIYANAVRIN